MPDQKIIVYYLPPERNGGKPEYLLSDPTQRSQPVTAWLPEQYSIIEENGKRGILCPDGSKVFKFARIGWTQKPAVEYTATPSSQNNGKHIWPSIVRIELECLNLTIRQKVAAYKLKDPAPGQMPWYLNEEDIPDGMEYTKTTVFLPNEVKLKRRGKKGKLFVEKVTFPNAPKQRNVQPDTSTNFDGIDDEGLPYFLLRLRTVEFGPTKESCILSSPADIWCGRPKAELYREDFINGIQYFDKLSMNDDGTSIYIQTVVNNFL